MTQRQHSSAAFTIVELIIVITVIAILATLVTVGFGRVQATARDTTRIAHLSDIADAIKVYRLKVGNDIQAGSGCGSAGNGNGWFNYTSASYPASTLSCLIGQNFLNTSYTDPLGCTTALSNCSGYMKYTCGTAAVPVTYLYARLEVGGDTQNLINANICSSAALALSPYFMNYMVVVD